MDKTKFIIKKSLANKHPVKSIEFEKSLKDIESNVGEIKDVLSVDLLSHQDIQLITDFYKQKQKTLSIKNMERLLNSSKELKSNKSLYLPLLKTFDLINFKEEDENNENIDSFFSTLIKKINISAAELGDENNIHFLNACIKVIDFSIIKILEQNNFKFNSKNNIFTKIFNEEVKTSLWKEIDKNIDLLKILKTEVFGDKDILSEFINLETQKAASKNVDGLINN